MPRRLIPAQAIAVAALVAALMGGCERATFGARSALARYASAVERNDPEAAYALLSERARETISRERFIQQFKEFRPEALAQARQIRRALSGRDKGELRVEAEVPQGKARSSTLAVESGRWRIVSGPSQGALGTPAMTLRAFVRALERRDVDQVMRLLARRVRLNIERELRERVERLKASLDHDTIEIRGNRAELRYDRQYRIQLVRENGEWHVANFD